MDALEPTTAELVCALRYVSKVLDRTVTYAADDGRFHFAVSDDHTIAIASETAGRVSVETCFRGRPSARLLCDVRNRRRLARLVLQLREHAEAAV